MPGSGLDALVSGGQQGFDWMDRVLQTRKERATTEQGAQAKKALAERMAQGPATLGGGAIPTPGAAPPTTDFAAPTGAAPPGAIPAPGAEPAPADALPAEPTPGPNDPDVNQFELETKQRSGRDVPMGKDWDTFRQDLMRSAAAIGDPQTVKMIDEYVGGLQQKGFSQNASRAQMAATLGDQEATAHHLQKAFGYLNSGDAPRIKPIADGNFVVMPVDETSGKPSGDPLVLNAKTIGHLVAMASDPAKFAEWKTEAEADSKKQEADIKKGEATTDYQERIATTGELAQKETARSNLEDEKTARINAKAKKAVADAKETGKWNDAATRALDAQISRVIDSVIDQTIDDEVTALYDNNRLDIASAALNIVKATENYDTAAAVKLAQTAALRGHTIAMDEGTGELVIETPIGDIGIDEYQ